MTGKEKCKILKQIRKEIANQNDISYVVDECPHKGECNGTCPRCEAEVKYLEKELAKRHKAGLAVAIATGIIAVPIMLTSGDVSISHYENTGGAPVRDLNSTSSKPIFDVNDTL